MKNNTRRTNPRCWEKSHAKNPKSQILPVQNNCPTASPHTHHMCPHKHTLSDIYRKMLKTKAYNFNSEKISKWSKGSALHPTTGPHSYDNSIIKKLPWILWIHQKTNVGKHVWPEMQTRNPTNATTHEQTWKEYKLEFRDNDTTKWCHDGLNPILPGFQ